MYYQCQVFDIVVNPHEGNKGHEFGLHIMRQNKDMNWIGTLSNKCELKGEVM